MKYLRISLCFFCLFIGCYVYALPNDNQEKLYIAADNADINRETGIGIYSGNVQVTRGSTELSANKLTTYSDKNNQMIKAIAEGTLNNLATYHTLTDPNSPPLVAKAVMITYFPDKHYVILDNQAEIIQGKNSIKSPHLEYDLQKQILVTKKNKDNNKERTMIIIQPSDLKMPSNPKE
jgi:lipopolysaccharide export system protein LptA